MIVRNLITAGMLVTAPLAFAQVSAPPAATSSTPATSAQSSAPATASPATAMPKEVHWFRDSAEYHACALQAYKLARTLVDKNSAGLTSGTWAVVVDADETVLDNSDYEKALGAGKFNPKTWREWELAGQARAVPGAAAFLHHVHELGGKIAVVSNRSSQTLSASEHVFQKLKLDYDLMLNQMDTSFKERRFDAIQNGTTSLGSVKIVLFVGDNIQDFPGKRQTLREEPDSAFDEFGDRFVILPNPMYGSWERNPEE